VPDLIGCGLADSAGTCCRIFRFGAGLLWAELAEQFV
jgi:hypothetical protein